MYEIDIGEHGFILGLLYLLLKYFAPLIIVLIVVAIATGIGAVLYRRYKQREADKPLLIKPDDRSWLEKFLGL